MVNRMFSTEEAAMLMTLLAMGCHADLEPAAASSRREARIIQQPVRADRSLPKVGVNQRPAISNPTSVPVPQKAFSSVVFEIGIPKTSAP